MCIKLVIGIGLVFAGVLFFIVMNSGREYDSCLFTPSDWQCVPPMSYAVLITAIGMATIGVTIIVFALGSNTDKPSLPK